MYIYIIFNRILIISNNRKENSFVELSNYFVLGAMVTPGGERKSITSRFSRHFNLLSIDSFDDDHIKSIFLPIMSWYFSSFATEYAKFSTVISNLILQI